MTEPDLAQLHRPRDLDTLRAAACDLHARGLTVRDIASALRLGEDAVRELLAHPVSHRQAAP